MSAVAATTPRLSPSFKTDSLLAPGPKQLNVRRAYYHLVNVEEHPELLPLYFGNYTKIIYLAQTRDEELAKKAMAAAKRLGLGYEYRFVGYGELASEMKERA